MPMESSFAHLEMPGERIPNFCSGITITSRGSGNWSDVATWNLSRIPQSGDIVKIAPNTTVTYDIESDERINRICVEENAELKFNTYTNTKLRVVTIAVAQDGYLEIGNENNPVYEGQKAEIIFSNQNIDTSFDPSQYGNGLIALGKVRMHGWYIYPSYMRLAEEAIAGRDTIVIGGGTMPYGWLVGDKIVIPQTEPIKYTELATECEKKIEIRTIREINGNRVRLNSPLDCDHRGAKDGDNVTMRFLPHVANMTRNVILRSENPTGTRGHTLFGHRADVDIKFVSFKDLGRTRAGRLDSTTYDDQGRPTHIGTNQIGRYPVHMHRVWGPRNTTGREFNFLFVVNAIDNDDVHYPKWGIAVHDSHYGAVAGNVMYGLAQDGYVHEEGNESNNIIWGNFITGVGRNLIAERFNAYWFANPGRGNHFIDNVGASIFGTNNEPFGNTGTLVHLDFLTGAQSTVKLPRFMGADMANSNEYDVVDARFTTFTSFEGNEGYGMDLVFWNDHHPGPGNATGGHHIRDLKAWGVHTGAANAYGGAVTFENMVVRKFAQTGFLQQSTDGMIWLRNADIQNNIPDTTGVLHMAGACDVGQCILNIENSRLKAPINVHFAMATTAGAADPQELPRLHKRTVLRNVRFEAPAGIADPKNFKLTLDLWGARSIVPMLESSIVSYNHNQQAGLNYRIFFREQAPSFGPVPGPNDVVSPPGSGFPIYTCPVGGLTNQQCWNTYQRAMAGSLATCNTTYSWAENAFVCPQ